ncbi:kinase [Chloroflexota bacterium]
MIISRTPLRISFFGGGTDYPAFYEENGGAVLSTTMNKYSYVTCRYLPPFFDYKYRIRYSIREETQSISEIQHPSVRECLKFVDLGNRGIEIQHNADLPAMSGLGSSSAFTVGLLNVLYALKGKITTKRQLALEAIHIEQDRIKENVGSQDQTIASFGGFNKIEFGGAQKIWVSPVTVEQSKLDALQKHLMLFFAGFPRNASEIATEQIKRTPEKKRELTTMKEMVDEALNVLNGNLDRLTDFGKLLHESWKIKRSLTPHITTPVIDEIYQAAMEAGASGGKLLGAGGGGFMLFFVTPELQRSVRDKMKKLLYVPFQFHNLGSQIIYYAPEDTFWEPDEPVS